MISTFSEWISQRDQINTHRQLLVISGEQSWATEQINKIRELLETSQGLCISKHLHFRETESNTASQYRDYLGREFDYVIYDCFSGLRANALMALSGVIKRKGLMILLCPPLENWPHYQDPEAVRRTSYGFEDTSQPGNFVAWLCNHIKNNSDVAILSKTTTHFPLVEAAEIDNGSNGIYRTDEQRLCVESIINVATGHRNRPLVVSADRGRGKSSSLGLAAAQLLASNKRKIIVTAPHIKTVEQLFHHAQLQLPDSYRQGTRLIFGDKSIQFIALDALITELPDADLLMVDEAAAIPAPQLMSIIRHYSRCVLSTTIHGYEGTGRGFEFRVKPFLEQEYPAWREVTLKLPIRWLSGDSLEQFWFDVMLMRSEHKNALPPLNYEQLSYRKCTADDLLCDKSLLEQAFTLLVDAHYQTSQDDLVRLLDAKDLTLWLALQGDEVLAVILLAEEGGQKLIDVEEQISRGERRVNGHLIAQSLSYAYSEPVFSHFIYLRIVRIAVHRKRQKSGIGSRLIAAVKQHYNEENHFLATSFGLTQDLLKFWVKNGFNVVKLGQKLDASSGEHSVIMVSPMAFKYEAIEQELTSRFSSEVLYHCSSAFRTLSPHLMVDLLQHAYVGCQLETWQAKQVREFVDGVRPFDSCLPALMQFTLLNLQERYPVYRDELALMLSLSMQKNSVQDTCSMFDISGRKALSSRLRDACRLFLM